MHTKHFKKILLSAVFTGFLGLANAASIDDVVVAVRRDSDIALHDLQRQGVNPNARDASGYTPLTYAIHYKSEKTLPVLLSWPGIDLNYANAANETPLMLAAISGQVDVAKNLIQRGAAVNTAGWSPLLYAASRGNTEMIELLLANGAYVDAQAPNLATPLMYAAMFGDDRAVKLLLDNHADVWIRDSLNRTALQWAQRGKIQRSVELIQAAQQANPDYGKVKPAEPLKTEILED